MEFFIISLFSTLLIALLRFMMIFFSYSKKLHIVLVMVVLSDFMSRLIAAELMTHFFVCILGTDKDAFRSLIYFFAWREMFDKVYKF